MPVDPEIPLGVKFPSPAENPMTSALGTVGKFADIQNSMNQNILFKQTMEARRGIGGILANSPDLDTAIKNILSSPFAPYATEAVNALRQSQLAQVQMQGNIAEQASKGFEGFRKATLQVAGDPGQYDIIGNAYLQTVSPLARSAVANAIKGYKDSLFSNLPQDDLEKAKETYKRRIVGAGLSAGYSPEDIGGLTGKTVTHDVGDKLVTGTEAPAWAGSAFSPASSIPKGLAPWKEVVTGPFGPGGAPTAQIIRGGGVPSSGSPNPLGAGAGSQPGPSRPSASASAGVVAQGLPKLQDEYATARGKDLAAQQAGLDEKVVTGGTIMQTLNEAKDSLAKFKPGGGASTFAQIAQFAQAIGAPADLVDRIGNGNLAASQEFKKLMVNTTMGQIQSQLANIGASRLSQMEFQVFNDNNPNIDTDPRAIETIFNFWNKVYKRDVDEQKEQNKFIKAGGDISLWPQTWQEMAVKKGHFSTEVIEMSKKEDSPSKTAKPSSKTRRPMSDLHK